MCGPEWLGLNEYEPLDQGYERRERGAANVGKHSFDFRLGWRSAGRFAILRLVERMSTLDSRLKDGIVVASFTAEREQLRPKAHR
jgi:hypothetical protein